MLQLVNLRAYMALGDSGLYMKLHIIKLSIGVILLAAVALTFHDIYVIAFVNGAYTVFSIICIVPYLVSFVLTAFAARPPVRDWEQYG